MRDKYFPLKFDENQFHCIHCGVYAQQTWFDTWYSSGSRTEMRMSICSHCQKKTFWYEEKMVVPMESPVEPPRTDLPEDCVQDYLEARNVFTNSPRSAAALLRLCIQKTQTCHCPGKIRACE